jgi:hypothetical protein
MPLFVESFSEVWAVHRVSSLIFRAVSSTLTGIARLWLINRKLWWKHFRYLKWTFNLLELFDACFSCHHFFVPSRVIQLFYWRLSVMDRARLNLSWHLSIQRVRGNCASPGEHVMLVHFISVTRAQMVMPSEPGSWKIITSQILRIPTHYLQSTSVATKSLKRSSTVSIPWLVSYTLVNTGLLHIITYRGIRVDWVSVQKLLIKRTVSSHNILTFVHLVPQHLLVFPYLLLSNLLSDL